MGGYNYFTPNYFGVMDETIQGIIEIAMSEESTNVNVEISSEPTIEIDILSDVNIRLEIDEIEVEVEVDAG